MGTLDTKQGLLIHITNGPPLYPGEKHRRLPVLNYSARLQCFPVATLGKYHGSHSKDRKDKDNDKYMQKDKDKDRQRQEYQKIKNNC